MRIVLLLSQITSLLFVIILWGIGFTIYATQDINSITKIILPVFLFGIFAFLWKLKSNTKKIMIQMSVKTVSIFLSIGLTLTSINLLGFNIQLPPLEFVQLNIWIFLTLISMLFAQMIFKSKFITDIHYEKYPPFRVDMKKVIFLIPAFNESHSIGKLVQDIKSLYPESPLIVMDNNSSDNTAKIALVNGATVIHEKNQGKGVAVKSGFKFIDSFDYDVVIMMDGDLTYKPEDALKMINYSASGGYGVILGSRLKGKREDGAISAFNTFGNYILTIIANLLYGTNHSDICTGYWLFRKESVELLNEIGINSVGFGLEAEMISIFAQNNIVLKDLPISYGSRLGGKSHLQPLKDGFWIFVVLINNWIFSRKLNKK